MSRAVECEVDLVWGDHVLQQQQRVVLIDLLAVPRHGQARHYMGYVEDTSVAL
jgi:hypothetical protein